ncbi:MAG TPA: hypothetical protein PKD26_01950 [Pyrinomonadaceae bacterium]|nr:hypothetical protein [Pyrinomonadaceae bacterium]
MTHEENKIGGSSELFDPEEIEIAKLLSTLERVETPGDFDVRVRARIANARPAEVRPVRLFPILKYSLPLVLFLFTGAGVLYFSSLSDGLDQARVSGPVTTPSASFAEISPDVPPQPETSALPERSTTSENSIAAVPRPRRELTPTPRRDMAPVSGRSVDFPRSTGRVLPTNTGDRTLGVSQMRTPEGFPVKFEGVRAAFALAGVETEFRNGSWLVLSVNDSGVGKRIGILPGDRLKAIDKKPILEDTMFSGGIRGATISVLRGDRSIDLSLADSPK